jgi:tetratricopeptide (TPR) repeat protein
MGRHYYLCLNRDNSRGEGSQMFFIKTIKNGLFLIVALLAVWQSTYADGLPAENLLTQRWRDMIANHSPISNPAILTEENYLSLRIAFAPILDGEFKHAEVGLTIPMGLYQSLGLTFVAENDGSVFAAKTPTDATDYLVQDPNNGSSNSNYFVMLSYAYQVWSRLSLGINLEYATQTNFGSPLMGVGLDLGLTYRALRHPILGDHIFGIATQNLLAPQMTKTISFAGSNDAYARNLKFTWLSYYLEHRLESTLDYNLKDFIASAKEFKLNDSVSFAKQMEYEINYKLGLWLLKLLRVYVQVGVDDEGLEYWGMAVGFNAPGVNNGRDFEVLYQYNVMTQDDNDATAHTIYGRFDLGKHREEIWARKMARMASLSPNDLYNKARKLYAEQKYWDAFFIFSRLSSEFPDFFKIDWVEHYRASCQEEMDMRDAAIKNYQKMKKEFPLSSATPHSDLGLMRVFYRKGDFAQVANEYVELCKPNVPDSLRYHGAYLLGQTYLQQNDYSKALDILSKVPDGHPDYIFAQHAVAICQVLMNQDMSVVVATLENCVGAKAITEAQKEIVNRSYLFLGYIFFEENTLSKAIVSLRMVSTNSYFAEDALLGQGWTSLKARQWTDCITVGQMLTKTTDKDALKCEGMLIEAYGHLLQKEYIPALNLLKDASVRIQNVKVPDQDSLNFVRMQIESERMAHNNLAENVEYLASAGQTTAIVSQIDSLQAKQMDFRKKFKNFYKFSDDFSRTSFFSRNAQTIKEDIEYAFATVQKIVGQKGLLKEKEKIDDKQKSIDTEIEKLKSEMEKMQQKGK